MNIIICGAGRVGFTIAKLLSEQGHSITVIDQSSDDIQKINDSLDVKAIVGKATYPSILEKANALAFSRIDGYVAFPTIALTSKLSLIFWMSSLDWSITVIEWPCSLKSLAIVNPTLPAPQIIIFILIKFFNS